MNTSEHASPPSRSDTSAVSLILGMLDDLRRLFVQELVLARDEIVDNVLGIKWTLLRLMAAAVLILVGGILLVITGVHLLQAATGMPLWVCYAITGGALALGGGLLLWASLRQLHLTSLVPDKTMETMKGTTSWLKEQVESIKT